MRITELYTYAIKGCHRNAHDVVTVEPWGLAGDRRWMLVDADGIGITQREDARLTRLRARARDGQIELAAPGMPTVVIDEPADGPKEFIRVFRSQAPAPARVAESEWSTAFLGRPARLVWQADPTGRIVGGDAEGDDPVSFADGHPMLLANQASLRALNDWLVEGGDEAVPMTRFRPNLVLGGAGPWAEDGWVGRRLRIGDVVVRAAGSCARCLVTTIDQDTGEKGSQPLAALGRHRRFAGGLLFAIQLIPDLPPGGRGSLRVGDPVTVID
jgi:hypothetical protein